VIDSTLAEALAISLGLIWGTLSLRACSRTLGGSIDHIGSRSRVSQAVGSASDIGRRALVQTCLLRRSIGRGAIGTICVGNSDDTGEDDSGELHFYD